MVELCQRPPEHSSNTEFIQDTLKDLQREISEALRAHYRYTTYLGEDSLAEMEDIIDRILTRCPLSQLPIVDIVFDHMTGELTCTINCPQDVGRIEPRIVLPQVVKRRFQS